MKKIAGTLRLDLARFREMAAFAQFASDLDPGTRRLLARGERLTELLKQNQYVPLSVEKQILIIYAGTQGYVDDYPVSVLKQYEQELYEFIDSKHPEALKLISEKRELSDEVKKALDKALEDFKRHFVPKEGQ